MRAKASRFRGKKKTPTSKPTRGRSRLQLRIGQAIPLIALACMMTATPVAAEPDDSASADLPEMPEEQAWLFTGMSPAIYANSAVVLGMLGIGGRFAEAGLTEESSNFRLLIAKFYKEFKTYPVALNFLRDFFWAIGAAANEDSLSTTLDSLWDNLGLGLVPVVVAIGMILGSSDYVKDKCDVFTAGVASWFGLHGWNLPLRMGVDATKWISVPWVGGVEGPVQLLVYETVDAFKNGFSDMGARLK